MPFTSQEFLAYVEGASVHADAHPRGRALDNVFVKRLWRSEKYEEIYLQDYVDGMEAWAELHRYFVFYNTERRHQSTGRRTPADAHLG